MGISFNSTQRYSPLRISGFRQAVREAKPSNLIDLYVGWRLGRNNDEYDKGYYAGLVFAGLTSDLESQATKEFDL